MAKSKMINLKIDGKNVKVTPGTTIMDAAGSLEIQIPVICLLYFLQLFL